MARPPALAFLVVLSLIGSTILLDTFTSASDDLRGSDLRHRPTILPLYLSSPKSSFHRRDFEGRRLQKSDHPRTPNARMRLYDDLLSNGFSSLILPEFC